MLLFSFPLTFGQSDVNILHLSFPFIAYDLQWTYDGIYAPNLLLIICIFFVCLLHLTMFQDSFLICLTFGVM